jgi:ABC-type Fe3+-hydroxamate transport system substrate-binding protein
MKLTPMLRLHTRLRSFTRATLVLAVCTFPFALGACDGKTQASSAEPGGAATKPALPDDVVPAQPPQHIVAANAAAADYLRILVPASRVALLPEQVSEYSFLDFQNEGWERVARFANYTAEPVLGARADFVLTHAWQQPDTTNVLRAQNVPLLEIPTATSWDDIARTLERLGRVLHCEKAAKKEILRRGNVVERLAREAKKRAPLSALVYSNDGNSGSTAGTHTTFDTMLRMIGVKNASAALDGHAQIDFERLVVLDPDVIVLSAPAAGQDRTPTLDVLEKTPVLSKLRAVAQKHIVFLDGKLLSSDSPTIVDAADTLSLAIDDVLAGRKQ